MSLFRSFRSIDQVKSMSVRIGSLCLFEGGQMIPLVENWQKLYLRSEEHLQLVLYRLKFPYRNFDWNSNLGFVPPEEYMPRGYNLDDGSNAHSMIAGWHGNLNNPLGHRLRSMRVKSTDIEGCGNMYEEVIPSLINDELAANCYTVWWCNEDSCPNIVTPEDYDNGAGVYYLGTNILTSVIQSQLNKGTRRKLPMGTSTDHVQKEMVADIRANMIDMYHNFPEGHPRLGIH